MPERVELLKEIIEEKRAVVTTTQEAADDFQNQMDELQTLMLANKNRQSTAMNDIRTMNRLINDTLGNDIAGTEEEERSLHDDVRDEQEKLAIIEEEQSRMEAEQEATDPITLLDDEPDNS